MNIMLIPSYDGAEASNVHKWLTMEKALCNQV